MALTRGLAVGVALFVASAEAQAPACSTAANCPSGMVCIGAVCVPDPARGRCAEFRDGWKCEPSQNSPGNACFFDRNFCDGSPNVRQQATGFPQCSRICLYICDDGSTLQVPRVPTRLPANPCRDVIYED